MSITSAGSCRCQRIPEKIEEGGGWTLQRLVRETHPLPQNLFPEGDVRAPQATAGAQVLQQVRVQALDITVVKGSGDEIVQWGRDNGFFIDQETEGHLLGYAKGSPFFMAAKYDTAAARARGQLQGDGAPVLITMRIPHPWIPFEVLALDAQQTQADLYLLTDTPVYASDLDSASASPRSARRVRRAGLKVAFQEKMNAALYKDLSTDKNMGWVRPDELADVSDARRAGYEGDVRYGGQFDGCDPHRAVWDRADGRRGWRGLAASGRYASRWARRRWR